MPEDVADGFGVGCEIGLFLTKLLIYLGVGKGAESGFYPVGNF